MIPCVVKWTPVIKILLWKGPNLSASMNSHHVRMHTLTWLYLDETLLVAALSKRGSAPRSLFTFDLRHQYMYCLNGC